MRHHTYNVTPQQNSIAECMNRILYGRALSMLSHLCVSKGFWVEVINTSWYLVNRSPSITSKVKTFFEVWSSSSVDYSNLRLFSYPACAFVRMKKLSQG